MLPSVLRRWMTMINFSRCKRVITVFAHPDDETLAAGATISKLCDLGADVLVLIPATGVHARKNSHNEAERDDQIATLRTDCPAALGNLGVKPENIIFGEFDDNAMDNVPLLSVIHWLEPYFADFKPDLALTHHFGCTNVDHRVCHEAVTVVTRPSTDLRIPVLCGEVPSSTGYRRPTGFEPNIYVEVSEINLDNKIRSMERFTGEARPDPHPRSAEVLRAVSKVRGSEGGFNWAEAFMLLRAFA